MMIDFDKSCSSGGKFRTYEQKGGQEHDAGFDAYMTGHVFAAFCKRIEICELLKSIESQRSTAQAGASKEALSGELTASSKKNGKVRASKSVGA